MSNAVAFTVRLPVVYDVVLDESAVPATIPLTGGMTGLHLQASSGGDIVVNGTPYSNSHPPIGFLFEYYAVVSEDTDSASNEVYMHVSIPADVVSTFLSEFANPKDQVLWAFQIVSKLRSVITESSAPEYAINPFTDLRVWDMNLTWMSKQLGVPGAAPAAEGTVPDLTESIPMTCVIYPQVTVGPAFTDGAFTYTAAQVPFNGVTSPYGTLVSGTMGGTGLTDGYATALYDVNTNALNADKYLVSIPVKWVHYAARQGIYGEALSSYGLIPTTQTDVLNPGDPEYQAIVDQLNAMESDIDGELVRTAPFDGETVSDQRLMETHPLFHDEFDSSAVNTDDLLDRLQTVLDLKKGSWVHEKSTGILTVQDPLKVHKFIFECEDDDDRTYKERRLDLEI